MKTQKFVVEVTDLLGQYGLTEKGLERIINNGLTGNFRVNAIEKKI